jgi:hypothetical protein
MERGPEASRPGSDDDPDRIEIIVPEATHLPELDRCRRDRRDPLHEEKVEGSVSMLSPIGLCESLMGRSVADSDMKDRRRGRGLPPRDNRPA